MSNKHKFVGSVITILKHNKDGAFRTQNDRREYLISMAQGLYQDGFQLMHVRQLKPKHIWHLVKQWKANGDGPGTMKNRMSHVRWLLGKIDKAEMVPSNTQLGIPKRQYVTNTDKSRELTAGDLSKISSSWMQHILKGQALFGLRVEESLKLQPFICDLGHQLHVFKTKNGRERYVPINKPEQREWLAQAKALVKNRAASFIPPDVSYKTYRYRFEKACQRAGIHKLHGHRHLYAHSRFKELTGFACPAKGGPKAHDLNSEELALDKEARLQLSHELGHSREYVSSVYCGH